MEEKVIVLIFDGKKKIKENEFWNYDKAWKYAHDQVSFHGFTAKIQRLVDGKPWAVTTILPKEIF